MGVSIKLCYHPSVIKGKDGTLYYQIIIKRTTHTYTSGYRIYPNDWDKRHGRILARLSKSRIVPIGRCNKYIVSLKDILTKEHLWILEV